MPSSTRARSSYASAASTAAARSSQRFDLGDADRRAAVAGLDEDRQTHPEALELFARPHRAGGGVGDRSAGRRDAGVAHQGLEDRLVHPDGRARHAGADVRHAERLEEALQHAVLTAGAVNDRKDDVRAPGRDLGGNERARPLVASAEPLRNGARREQPGRLGRRAGSARPRRPPRARPRTGSGRGLPRSCAPRSARLPARPTCPRRARRPGCGSPGHHANLFDRGEPPQPVEHRRRRGRVDRDHGRGPRTVSAGEGEVRDVDAGLAEDRARRRRRRPERRGCG